MYTCYKSHVDDAFAAYIPRAYILHYYNMIYIVHTFLLHVYNTMTVLKAFDTLRHEATDVRNDKLLQHFLIS